MPRNRRNGQRNPAEAESALIGAGNVHNDEVNSEEYTDDDVVDIEEDEEIEEEEDEHDAAVRRAWGM